MIKIFLLLVASVALSVITYAQPGAGFQRRTSEERAAAIHLKLDSAFKLETSKLAMLDTALTVLYKKQDARMQEIFAVEGKDLTGKP